MSTQERLNNAVLYALRQGCFFPVPAPRVEASVLEWRQWGAMRNLHTAIAEFFRQSASGAPEDGQ